MDNGYSWDCNTYTPILVEEAELRAFLIEMATWFSSIRYEAKFEDDVKIIRSDAALFLADIAKQERRLCSVDIYGQQATNPDVERYRIVGSISASIGGLPRWPKFHCRINHSEEIFFAIKDRVEQFAKNCRPWYGALYSTPIWLRPAIWLALFVLCWALLAKLMVVTTSLVVGKEAVKAWLAAPTNGILSIGAGVNVFIVFSVLERLQKALHYFFPPSMILVGTEKKRYDRVKDMRKWFLGFSTATLLTSVWWLLNPFLAS